MNYAIILAGGYGIRFNSGNLPKQFVEMTGMPMVEDGAMQREH